MRHYATAAIALTVLLLTAGAAAAAPGNAPSDARAADAGAQGGANASEQVDGAEQNASGGPEMAADRDTGADAAGERGPPADLPGQVPDHVSAVHDQIRQFLSGALDGSLGDAVSGVAGGEGDVEESGDADESSDGGSGNESTTGGEQTDATATDASAP